MIASGRHLRFWVAAAVAFFALGVKADAYPDRWVFLWDDLKSDGACVQHSNLLYNAKACGFNGLTLYCGRDFGGKWDDVRANASDDPAVVAETCGVDLLAKWSPSRLERLRTLKRICDGIGFRFVPIVWSVGYCSMQAHDPNMAAAFPIRDVPYVRKGGRLLFGTAVPLLANAGFEARGADGTDYDAWRADKPGVLTFRDETTFRSGKASARFELDRAPSECPGEMPKSRAHQDVALKPHRRYRVSAWVRTRDLAGKGARMAVYGKGGEELQVRTLPLSGTRDWTYFEMYFNSQEATGATLWVGGWDSVAGTIWFDDVDCSEVGLQQVVQRKGAPVRVVGLDNGRVYESGRDYVVPKLRALSFDSPRESLEVDVPSGSEIPEGETVLISAYEPVTAYGVQFSACLSNPDLGPFYEASARLIERELSPESWLLSADEMRVGCRCELCSSCGKSRARLLADQVRLQAAAVKRIHPGARIYAWSDMFDENHNAIDRFWQNDGSYAGGAELLPKDVVMVGWWAEKAEKSMPRFSSLGLSTMAGAYYDQLTVDGTVNNCRLWLKAMNKTPDCRGIIYVTWGGNYQQMPVFGQTLRRFSKPMNGAHSHGGNQE